MSKPTPTKSQEFQGSVVLLGGGASVEAGVPAARPIVAELLDVVRDDSNGIRMLRDTLKFVWETLVA